MPWVNPITDRTYADILNRTSKAFFNVADWQRIYNNTWELNQLVNNLRGLNIEFTPLTSPTIATIPSANDINALILNIERIRLASGLPISPDLQPLKTDWQSGFSAAAIINYETVNTWEKNLLTMWNWIQQSLDYLVFAGIGSAGQDRIWQNRFRRRT